MCKQRLTRCACEHAGRDSIRLPRRRCAVNSARCARHGACRASREVYHPISHLRGGVHHTPCSVEQALPSSARADPCGLDLNGSRRSFELPAISMICTDDTRRVWCAPGVCSPPPCLCVRVHRSLDRVPIVQCRVASRASRHRPFDVLSCRCMCHLGRCCTPHHDGRSAFTRRGYAAPRSSAIHTVIVRHVCRR